MEGAQMDDGGSIYSSEAGEGARRLKLTALWMLSYFSTQHQEGSKSSSMSQMYF